jgi:membrane fusion protein, multidrug efflux system
MELLLENKDLAIPAGLTGMATFKLSPAPETYLVPTNALLIREGRTMVATVKDSSVHFVELLPGRNFGHDVEVTSSQLSDSTPVILNPNAMLRQGDVVAVAQLTAAK